VVVAPAGEQVTPAIAPGIGHGVFRQDPERAFGECRDSWAS
jgi:hypothetical protein